MKIIDNKPNIKTSGSFKETFFSIQDQGMIFDILRNKMYSDPITAICREISCNCRDAHREINIEHVPVKIVLPTYLDQSIKFIDYGPGISEDRMLNIFIKYTASTKRDDNVQTGGFGLGAKTPFSYSDTFTIKTKVNGIKYTYACIIDETKVGKLFPLKQEPIPDSEGGPTATGTEIEIPVKQKDVNLFEQAIIKTTNYWKVKPIITNSKLSQSNPTVLYRGNGWFIEKHGNYDGRYNNIQIKAIVDGIEYPVGGNQLKTFCDTTILQLAKGTLALVFKVGEISLSANREQIYFDERTKKFIKTKIETILDEVKNSINVELDKIDNYLEANLTYQTIDSAFSTHGFANTIKWRGLPIYMYNRIDMAPIKVVTFYREIKKDGSEVSKKRVYEHLELTKDVPYIMNDLGIAEKDVTPAYAKRIFSKIQDKKVFIICPSGTLTEKELNKKYHIDRLGYQKLSDLTELKKTRALSGQKLIVYKYNYGIFNHVAYSTFEDDSSEVKIICKTIKEFDANHAKKVLYIDIDGDGTYKKISNENLDDIMNLAKIVYPNKSFSIYGVDHSTNDDRINDAFEGCVGIRDFIEDVASKIDFAKYYAISSYNFSRTSEISRLMFIVDRIEPFINNKDSLFVKTGKDFQEMAKLADSSNAFVRLYSSLMMISSTKFPQFSNSKIDEVKKSLKLNLSKEIDKCVSKYRLLNHLNMYNLSADQEEVIKALAGYINLVDKN